jgi:hypothetical protein
MNRFKANYPGTCRSCAGLIKVGEYVSSERGQKGLLCSACTKTALAKQPSRRGGKKAFAAALKAQGPL